MDYKSNKGRLTSTLKNDLEDLTSGQFILSNKKLGAKESVLNETVQTGGTYNEERSIAQREPGDSDKPCQRTKRQDHTLIKGKERY